MDGWIDGHLYVADCGNLLQNLVSIDDTKNILAGNEEDKD
ncbi:MAG: hypothetical protein H6Q43_3659, partial [Deltaproteobacteria bacterium]|nr:hypothetical protein [Deltaproteobacteria bacterium]